MSMQELQITARPSTAPPVPSFRAVFFAPLASVVFLLARPKLLLLELIPIFLNTLLFSLLVYLGWEFVTAPTVGLIDTPWDWLDGILRWLAGIVLMLLLVVMSALLAVILIIPVGAPFHDFVTEKIEQELLAVRPELIVTPPPLLRGIVHAIFEGLRRVLAELPILLLIFTMSWVPIVGTSIALVIAFFNAAYFLPVDALSYSMDRREWDLRRKFEWLRGHLGLWRPLGYSLGALILIPCNIVWFPPLAAVAATRLFCGELLREAEEREALPPAP